MNIANYTSGVAAIRSIADIEEILIAHGAVSVNKRVVDGKISAVAFAIPFENHLINICLPANVENVFAVMKRDRAQRTSRVLTVDLQEKLLAQAERTAWRIQWEWVRVQMALVRMRQVELLEVFLPYVITDDRGTTLYSQIRERKFAGLLPAPTTP